MLPGMSEPASFDQVVDRLRQVVERLEAGQLSLEDALKAFEEGVGLARHGHALLDAAERRVELLLASDKEPSGQVVPFPEG